MQTSHFKYLSTLVFSIFLATPQIVFSQQEKPNIILIFADDLGIESLKPYGGHSTVTPNIDKLADSGMLFTHCFANPACSPSRAELPVPLPEQSIRGRSFLLQLLGKKGNPKEWVHVEYKENRQIRTRDWIYNNKRADKS